jgi:hypothetical protein
MIRIPITVRLLLLCSFLGFGAGHVCSQTSQVDKAGAASAPADSQKEEQIGLRLVDGTLVRVDEAWENSQGIWYRQGGLTHLVSKGRVKAIERTSPKQQKTETAFSEPVQAAPTRPGVFDKPAWIYLKGGARVEADSATESAAGVWYKRGTFQIFIDHSRIDHVEAEEVENVADSSQKKERGWSTGSQKLDGLIKQNGNKYGVDPYLVFLVMEQESHFNTRVVSPKGARGLMQLMPGTSARFGVRHPHDPAQNISGGTRFLKQLLDRFNNRVDLVLASYNAGEGAVLKYGHKVPPYRETREYVKRISYRYRRNAVKPKGQVAGNGAAPTGER